MANASLARFSEGLRNGFLGTPSPRRDFVIAGAAPDIPLYLLSAGALAYYPRFRGLSISEIFQLAFDDLFADFWRGLTA